MIILGVDYSINSPAVAVIDTDGGHARFHYIAQKSCQLGEILPNVIGSEAKVTEGIERYNRNASFVLGAARRYKVDHVAIEGYSYGSRSSSVFQIAENGGVLKIVLHNEKIPFTIIAPPQVKKIATGKGNADKLQMYDAWLKESQLDLVGSLKCKADSNPVSDIVDAYFIARAYVSLMGSKIP